MIRIYLDWNIFRKLQDTKDKSNNTCFRLINENKGALLVPFSNYHVEDILHNNKTEEKIEKYVRKDLEFLGEISQEHYLGMNKDGEVVAQIGSPLRFLDNIDFTKVKDLLNIEIVNQNLGIKLESDNNEGVIKALLSSHPLPSNYEKIKHQDNELLNMIFPSKENHTNLWDMVVGQSEFMTKFLTEKRFYKTFRKTLQEQLNISNGGQGTWEANEVIPNLNDTILKFTGKEHQFSFDDLLEMSTRNLTTPNKLHNKYISTYVLLDMLGYQSDKLDKSNNDFFNIQHDAVHCYLGSYCDIVVSEDERFIKKTKVVYDYFKTSTLVLNTNEFNSIIGNLLHSQTSDKEEFLKQALSYKIPSNEIKENNPAIDYTNYKLYKLENYFLNYFNYLIVETIQPDNVLHLKFRRVFKNNSWFVYFLETKNLLDEILKVLGTPHTLENVTNLEQDFIYNESNAELRASWLYNGVAFCLEKEIEKGRECLSVFIALNKVNYEFKKSILR